MNSITIRRPFETPDRVLDVATSPPRNRRRIAVNTPESEAPSPRLGRHVCIPTFFGHVRRCASCLDDYMNFIFDPRNRQPFPDSESQGVQRQLSFSDDESEVSGETLISSEDSIIDLTSEHSSDSEWLPYTPPPWQDAQPDEPRGGVVLVRGVPLVEVDTDDSEVDEDPVECTSEEDTLDLTSDVPAP